MADVVFDPLKVDWSGDFDAQVQDVLNKVRLTRGDVDRLAKLLSDLENSLKTAWRGCQVMPFGSIMTGLGILGSDVDCYAYVPDDYEYDQANFVIKARNVLRKRQWIFREPFAIPSAKVPIVKFFHIPTQRHCDVNFKGPSGVRNSKLIGHLLQMDKRALPFAILIKYWSKVHKLTGTNLLPNYGLSLMIIFFLQYKNILPPVSLLQHITNDKFFVDDWNTAFSEDYQHQTNNTDSLYKLLGEFFQYYSTFRYNEFIISPFLGSTIPRRLFDNIETVPNGFDLYKSLISEGESPLNFNKPMCVQDFFEHNRNCTGAVYPRLAVRLKSHFQLAAKIYSESSNRVFFKEILLKKPNIPKPKLVARPNLPHNNTNKKVPKPENKPVAVAPRPMPLKRPRPAESLTALFNRGRNAKRRRK